MKRNVAIGIATIVAALVGFFVAYSAASAVKEQQQRPKAIVNEVCGYSRTVRSAQWEQACGLIQDATNTKYTCKSYQDGTFCMAEDK